ncbi:glycosyltransferase [Calothrix sp. CCY 0018]|uniref:glycosyltransferase family 2 protein n=1 Tax=Calothrix sp. CCY 0018 TaxID=3103864 RepID=UPI0039C65849
MNTKKLSEYNFNYSQQLETDAILELAVKHQLGNRLADAEQLYHQVLEKQPLHLQALYNLASLHQTQGDLESAIAFYQKVIKINPNDGEVHLQLGKIYQQQGSLQNAISAYRQGISLINPCYAEVLKNRTSLEVSKTVSVTPPEHQGEVSVSDYQFPEIPRVSKELGKRPFWSVVLPIYSNNERVNYILECFVSILTQWNGKEEMEIVVVDDNSPIPLKDLVDELGIGIISYYRNNENRGAYRNFNTAVAMSKGKWIHLLHDDDYVLPGFYNRLRQSLEESPDSVGAAFTNYQNVNEQGKVIFTQQLYEHEPRIIKDFAERIGITNPLNMPAVVVRRSTYEHLGGYLPELNYTGDWEFYKRVTAFYDWWYEPQILACYREHSQNITTDSMLSGSKGTDIRKAIEVSEKYLSDEISVKSRHYHFACCLNNAIIPLKAGKTSGALLLIQEALKIENSPQSVTKLFSWLKQDELSALRDEIVSRLLLEGLKVDTPV